MKKNVYISTTLPYVNADPHIGFALEIVQADALARFSRFMGLKVYFNTGTDEHGQKIYQKALEEGVTPHEYVERFTERFLELKTALNLSYDNFIRTTSAEHVHAAEAMWRHCADDIYKKKYTGKYCVGDEMFVRDSDLVDGKCPNHPNMELEEIEEENYFFRFSAYQDKLLEYLERDEVIIPEWRRKEAIAFVEGGLEDFSISREAKRMSWGIPVPGDESQVMYVWFDALTNYISTLGWPDDRRGEFEKFWVEGETVQIAGKDQVRFQSLMWQAMLMAAKLPTTDHIFYHGFITSGGVKMSKSVGNVINPLELVERYGTDAVRYLLLRHVHPSRDTDITIDLLDDLYEAHLVNGLGNTVSRIMKLAETYLDEPIEQPKSDGFEFESERAYIDAIERFAFNEVLDFIWGGLQLIDHKIAETEPFKVVKVDKERGVKIIAELVRELYFTARVLEPFLPETSQKIKEAILENKKPKNLFPRLN